MKIEIAPDQIDAVDEHLLIEGYAGWSVYQDVLANRAWLLGIGPDDLQLALDWQELRKTITAIVVTPVRALADRDWRDSYKDHFHPWSCGTLHWVPEWERAKYVLPAGAQAIWLDPGLAFGTGSHETTRLCCEELVAFHGERGAVGQVIDAGCGSGILALSAVRLAFTEVSGFDNDPEAVRVSEENAALNSLVGAVEFYEGDLITGLAGRSADLVLANILGHILAEFAAELVAAVKPGGWLVLSGILAVERRVVEAAFRRVAPGWAYSARDDGEWAMIRLVRPA